MAKKKSTVRRTRLAASQAQHHSMPSSKAASVSASPSAPSSPAPQFQDPTVSRRRKRTPFRSPAQGDSTKGIVFAFRIQNDPDRSMAVDILKYDQQDGPPDESDASPLSEVSALSGNTSTASTFSTAASTPADGTMFEPNHFDLRSSRPSSFSSEGSFSSALSSSFGTPTAVTPPLLSRRSSWSNDPTSFMENNVVDLTRNLLILHSRRPSSVYCRNAGDDSEATTSRKRKSMGSLYPYDSNCSMTASSTPSSSATAAAAAAAAAVSANKRTSYSAASSSSDLSLPSTPPLSESSSSSSSAPPSPTSSSSPSPAPCPTTGLVSSSGACDEADWVASMCAEDGALNSKSRYLAVRGLGRARSRMQVIIVS